MFAPTKHPTRRGLLVALAAIAFIAAGVQPGIAHESSSDPVLALFDGHQIDLSEGWDEAQACLVLAAATMCYRTVDELAAAEASLLLTSPQQALLAANCSTPLRLYSGTHQTGSVLSIASRGVWVNLGDYGFSNQTSSYKVGACAVELATGTNGSGNRYFRCLNAFCTENVMASGWNNVMSSVYLK